MDQKIDLDNLPESTKTRYPGAKGIPIEAIVDLRSKNLSSSQIAKLLGCNPSNITRRLHDLNITKQYINNKGFMIRHLEHRIYNNITDTKLQKSTAKDLGVLYGIIYDKGQLEEGGPTQNIAYADALKARDQVKMSLEEIREVHKQRHLDTDINIIDISPSPDSQGIEGKAECG